MAREAFGVVPLLLCASLLLAFATAQESTGTQETYDLQKELEKLKGVRAKSFTGRMERKRYHCLADPTLNMRSSLDSALPNVVILRCVAVEDLPTC